MTAPQLIIQYRRANNTDPNWHTERILEQDTSIVEAFHILKEIRKFHEPDNELWAPILSRPFIEHRLIKRDETVLS